MVRDPVLLFLAGQLVRTLVDDSNSRPRIFRWPILTRCWVHAAPGIAFPALRRTGLFFREGVLPMWGTGYRFQGYFPRFSPG